MPALKKRNLVKKIKNVMKKRVGQSRKKGAVLIEFIVALPVFMFMLWGIMNLMLYLIASSALNEAAYEASRGIAVELRGDDSTVIDYNKHVLPVISKVSSVVQTNNFVKLYDAGSMPNYYDSEAECNKARKDGESNMFCYYIEEYTPSGSLMPHQQVVVKLRSGFNLLGSFIPGLEKFVHLNAPAVAQKELTGRTNYISH